MSGSLPDQKETTDPKLVYGDTRSIARIFYWITLVTFIALVAGVFVLLSNKNYWQAIFLAGGIPFIFVNFYFLRRDKYELAASFLAVVLFLQITVQSTYGQGIHHLANLGFPAILIIASLVVRKRTLALLTLIAVLCAAWLVFGELAGLYTPGPMKQSIPSDFITVAVILIATSFMVSILTDAVIRSNRGLQHELVERERMKEQLAYEAQHDALTNLPNRTYFIDRLTARLIRAKSMPERLFAVLFLDLDRFKVVNDSLGHAVGDEILIAAAQRIKECLRSEDVVARLSGDEFAILLHDMEDTHSAMRVAERIQAKFSASSMLTNVDRITTASIGIAIYNFKYTQPQEMLRDADSAMYRAKASGGACAQVFDDSMYASALSLLRMETDLKYAVAHEQWQIHYQPIVSLPDMQIQGVEALVRWLHPERGLISPMEFINIAEETGQIFAIGRYVLRNACAQVRQWREQEQAPLWVSVNLSARQFQDKGLVDMVKQVLAETGLPAEALKLEVTESVAMKDIPFSIRVLKELSQMGVGASLDDFGNGYSSLGYLNQFPFKSIKIDHSFIQDIKENRSSEAIILAIIAMGHNLNLTVVAEGVETEAQMKFLSSSGCDFLQGYYYSRPLPANELAKLITGKGG